MIRRSMAVASLLAALSCMAADSPGKLDGLAWMAGGWGSERDGTWTEEWWIAPRFGVMLGVNRSGRAGKAASFEFIRISEETDGSLIYWGGPQGAKPTPFKLVASAPEHVVFANPGHDFPQRIEYRREGTTMTATVSGTIGGKTESESWTWQRLAER